MTLLDYLPVFLLIVVRLASFFIIMPAFSYKAIPPQIKIGLSVALAFIIVSTAVGQTHVEFNSLFVLLIIKEAVVGLSIGFVAGLLLYAVQVAGAFIDLQIGFTMANTINPENGVTSPITGQFLYTFALLLFLSSDGHLMLINGLLYSFKWIPLNTLNIHITDGSTVHMVLKTFMAMVGIAFQLAMPIIGSLFLVDVALGIVARTVPQVNVFVVGMPLKILVSFIILIIVFPMMFMLFKEIIDMMTEAMTQYMKALGSP